MATVTKEWTNGDLLTLITSAGGIAVSSAENLTGADRQMTIRVQTTNQGTKAFQDVLIKQNKVSVIQDGYWVHKDTAAKTYFGADADFITNGVMSRPSWIVDAKEIKLCTGITEFKITHLSNPEWGDFDVCEVFNFIPYEADYTTNDVLEKIDFGNANIEALPVSLFFAVTALKEVILNDNVTTIGQSVFDECVSLESADIGSGVSSIGYGVFGYCPSLYLVYIRATTPPLGEWRIYFGTINTNLQLKVPSASVSAYITAITDATLKSKVTAI